MGQLLRLRVLIVEDDETQSHMLRKSLNMRGHVVVHAADRGDDPLLASVQADVGVVDLSLPGKSGVEVIRALHARAVPLPVLVLSASAHSAAVTEALLAGALGFVVKGTRLSEVIDAVELVAQKKQVLPTHPRSDGTRSQEGAPVTSAEEPSSRSQK
jgi:DNA-binding NarL/FixJ family response regulator